MEELMTIQTFSERTGIAKSALRYYESVQLLRPIRKENGYRLYSEGQITTAKMISGLRLAGVSIRDIQRFLEEGETARRKMIDHWLKTLREKRRLLEIGLRFLEGYQKDDRVYLLEKKAEKVVWFAAEAQPGRFGQHFEQRKKELDRLAIRIHSGYFRYLSGRETVRAQIGFGVADDADLEGLSKSAAIETLPACLCIALPYTSPITEIRKGYVQLMNYAIDHQFIPAGPIMEWYRGERFKDVDLIMPVAHIGNMEREGFLWHAGTDS
jgi:DNA-binding transcriptional MerR regulator